MIKTSHCTWMLLLSLGLVLLLIAACSQPQATQLPEEVPPPTGTVPPEPTTEPQPTNPPPTEPPPTEVLPTEAPPTEVPPTEIPPTEVPPTETTALDAPENPALAAEPQVIEFTAEDGQQLIGTYYPAAINPAPMVVLMHWAPGDQCDWKAIAPWLQNRGVEVDCTPSTTGPWLDASWFPPLPERASYGVFTFTFRGCEGGCGSFQPDGWLLDARAAMETASELEGVDPARLAAIGASSGADGAIDACTEGCLGALSLSPGDYLTLSYAGEVERLGATQPPVPATCLAAEGDGTSADACRAASGKHFEAIIYSGSEHGVELIVPGMDPETIEVILGFVVGVLGP